MYVPPVILCSEHPSMYMSWCTVVGLRRSLSSWTPCSRTHLPLPTFQLLIARSSQLSFYMSASKYSPILCSIYVCINQQVAFCYLCWREKNEKGNNVVIKPLLSFLFSHSTFYQSASLLCYVCNVLFYVLSGAYSTCVLYYDSWLVICCPVCTHYL